MPSLIDRFTNLINRLRPSTSQTTSDELGPRQRQPGRTSYDVAMELRLEYDRRSIVQGCRQMYKEDTRVKGFIKTLARDAVKGGFEVVINEATNPDQAKESADDLVKRVHLFTRLDDWVRLTFRDGDSFLESSVDRDGLIQQVTRKPTLQMHRNSDQTDRFPDPSQAYWYGDDLYATYGPPGDAIWFADWQIIHARWDHDEGSRYGLPLFDAARRSYKFAKDGENDIWVRRRTRAGVKYQHKIEGGPDAIDAYIAKNKDTLDNPKAAIQDFFGNVEIKVIQGDAQLEKIADVEHHIETFSIASPVPSALIGYGKNINRDILKEKKEQYDDALPQVSDWVADQMAKPLIELQWLLLGMWPGHIDYELKWASKKVLTAEQLLTAAKAGLTLQMLGWPEETIIEILMPLIPGLDPEKLKAAMEKLKAGQPDEINRISSDASANA